MDIHAVIRAFVEGRHVDVSDPMVFAILDVFVRSLVAERQRRRRIDASDPRNVAGARNSIYRVGMRKTRSTHPARRARVSVDG